MEMEHYKRCLDGRFIKELQGSYSFLIECSHTKIGGYEFNAQLRPGNKIMIYYGGTCLLTATYNGLTGTISFESNSYGKKHAAEFHAIKIAPLKSIKKACYDFLKVAAKNAGDKWHAEGSEGYFENKLCRLWGGLSWQEYMDMLLIDRQAIISFDNDQKKQKFYNAIKRRYLNITQTLAANNTWKEKTTLGDELDLLAIGPNKELVCIELKTASKDKGFYYAPLQAAAYCEAFATSAHTISNDIKEIVKQKVSLGLLPKTAINRLPAGNFNVRCIVLIMDAHKLSLDSEVWGRLDVVRKQTPINYRPTIIAIP